MIDIRDKVEKDRDAELTTDDLMAWLDVNGPLPTKSVVFVLTGWGSRYGLYFLYFLYLLRINI